MSRDIMSEKGRCLQKSEGTELGAQSLSKHTGRNYGRIWRPVCVSGYEIYGSEERIGLCNTIFYLI